MNRDKEGSAGERHPFDHRCLRLAAGPVPWPRRQPRSSSPRQSCQRAQLHRSGVAELDSAQRKNHDDSQRAKDLLTQLPRDRTSCKRCQFRPPVALYDSQTDKQERFGKKQNKQLSWTLHPTARPHVVRFKRRSLHTPNRCASVNNCEVAFARINTPIDSPFSTQQRLESQPRTRSRPAKYLPAA